MEEEEEEEEEDDDDDDDDDGDESIKLCDISEADSFCNCRQYKRGSDV